MLVIGLVNAVEADQMKEFAGMLHVHLRNLGQICSMPAG